jgi:chaperonin GroES
MQDKLLKTTQAEYNKAVYSGRNESGITPFGDRVLILPDTAAEKSSGGVFIPETNVEQQSYAAETGVLVAIGPGAYVWNSDRTRPFSGDKPEVGQRVFFDRYSGGVHRGTDGRLYRIMDDKAVAGRFDEAARIGSAVSA